MRKVLRNHEAHFSSMPSSVCRRAEACALVARPWPSGCKSSSSSGATCIRAKPPHAPIYAPARQQLSASGCGENRRWPPTGGVHRAPRARSRGGGSGAGTATDGGSAVIDGGRGDDGGVQRDVDGGVQRPRPRTAHRAGLTNIGTTAAVSSSKSRSGNDARARDIARGDRHGHLRISSGSSGGSELDSSVWSQKPRKNDSRGADRLKGPGGGNGSGGGDGAGGPVGPAADWVVTGVSEEGCCDVSGSEVGALVGVRGDGGSRGGRLGRGSRHDGVRAGGGGGRAGRGLGVGSEAASSRRHRRSSSSREEGEEAARRINRAIVEAGRARRHEDILQVVEKSGADFDAVNVATSLHRLGSCGLPPGGREAARLRADPRLGRLLQMAGQHLSSFAAREVANCLWALAKLGYTQQQQQQQQPARAGADDGVATAALWRAPCRGGGSRRPDIDSGGGGGSVALLLEGLCARAEAVIQGFGPQELSNTLWGLARLGHRHGALQAAIHTQAQKRITEFKPQEISNFVLAAATLELGPKGGGGGDSGSEGGSEGGGLSSGSRDHQQQPEGLMPAALLRQCCDRAAVTLREDAPQGLSNTLWAVAKMGYCHKPLLSAAAKLASEDLAELLDGHATGGAGGSGVGGGRPPGGVRAVGPVGPAGAPRRSWTSQAVANVSWAYATLGFQPVPEFLGLVCRHMTSPRHLPDYNWQDLANLMWALATLQHYDPTVLAAVEQQVVAAVAPVAAGTGPGTDGCQRLRRELQTMRLQHVSNLLWAFASLRHPAPALFAALTPLLERRLPDVDDRDICIIVWSAAKLGHYDGRLLDVLAAHLCAHSRLQHLSPQMAANLAWGYGELRHAHRALLDGLVARTLAAITASTAALAAPAPATNKCAEGIGTGAAGAAAAEAVMLQDLSGVCGAVGILGWRYPELVDAVEGWLLASSYGSDGSITNTSTRHQAQGQWGDGASTKGRVTATVAEAEAAAITGAVPAAAAAAGGRRGALVREEQSICSLAWGLSLMGGCGPRTWGQLVGALERLLEGREGGGGVETLLDEEAAQLYQAYLHSQLDYPAASTASWLAPGPSGLLSRGARVWRQQCRQGASVSAFQRQVSETLTRIGVKHTVEVLTEDGDFSVDLAVDAQLPPAADLGRGALGRRQVASSRSPSRWSPTRHQRQICCDGTTAGAVRCDAAVLPAATPASTPPSSAAGVLRIAVEADGPWHFTANTLQPLGTSTCRRRCLEARGWKVVSVPYWRWNQAGGSHAEQDALLTELLWGAGLADVLAAAVRAW